MKVKILITGPPRCGKSTLILKVIAYCIKNNMTINGFLTPEVRKGGNRIGFDIEIIGTKERKKLARIGEYDTKYKLGKYNVFVKQLEEIISKLENSKLTNSDILIIDEIGKMELYSKKFHNFITDLFNQDQPIIATIGEKLNHPIKNKIIKNPHVVLFTLSRVNQDKVFQNVINLLKKIKN